MSHEEFMRCGIAIFATCDECGQPMPEVASKSIEDLAILQAYHQEKVKELRKPYESPKPV